MALIAITTFLVACTGSRNWTYTASIYPVFLDDSTAAVFLMDHMETTKFMESPRISQVALRGYRVNYRTPGDIAAFTKSTPAGDLAYGPVFSLTRDLVFATTSGWRNPLIAIDRKTGTVQENTREICCVRRLDDWLVPGKYFFLSDTGTFHLLDLKNRDFFALDPDTLFGFSPGRWYDLHYDGELLSATFVSGDSLWLVDMKTSDRAQTRFLLPPLPEALSNYGKLDVTFGSNNGYLRLGPAGGGGLLYVHTISLADARSGSGASTWTYESKFTFNEGLTAKSRILLHKDSWLPLDSTHVVILDQNDKVLADYDFSRQMKK